MKKITFWLLLTLSMVAVFTSCKDDSDEKNTDTTDTTAVTGIALDKTTLILAIGEEYTLTATVSLNDTTDKTVTWTSSDTTKATVTNGKVTAVAAGKTIITAKASDKTVTCTVTISNMPTVTDIDGNVYHTITIDTLTWMIENLKVTTYNDGTAIPNVTDATAWAALSTGAYCDYNNLAANGAKYGHLYNWHTVNTGKLAPAGWHVPTNAELDSLQAYLIKNDYNYDGTTTDNKIAKSLAATTDWTTSTATGAIGNDLTLNNSTGFSALPGGYRYDTGSFYHLGNLGYWWSATEFDSSYAWRRTLGYSSASLNSSGSSKQGGFSVRCVKD